MTMFFGTGQDRCKTIKELKILVAKSVKIYNEMIPHLSLDMKNAQSGAQ